MAILPNPRRRGLSYTGLVAYLLGFAVLLLLLLHYFLEPAAEVAHRNGARGRHWFAAVSCLLLAVLLAYLLAGLVLVYRMGRFYSGRSTTPPPPTKYVDVWAEAGKRAKPADDDPPAEE